MYKMFYKPVWISRMLSKEYIRRRLLGAADACGALLCGVVAVLAMRSFDDPAEFCSNWNGIVRAAALAIFIPVAAAGIFGRPARAPKVLFVAGIAVAAFLPPPDDFGAELWLLYLYMPLVALLIFGAMWRGARFAVLPLTVMTVFTLTAPPPEEASPDFPDSLYLPASLMTECPGGRILAAGDEFYADFWRDLPYVSKVDQLRSFPKICGNAAGIAAVMRRIAVNGGGPDGLYDIIAAGTVNDAFGDTLLRGFYRRLTRHFRPGGVMVMPFDHTRLLPPGDWRFAVVPGGEGEWMAARRGAPAEVSPEQLDRRLQEFCGDPDSVNALLLPGAFAAMYSPVPEARAAEPPPAEAVYSIPAWTQWSGVAVLILLWFLLRLPLCRKAAMGTAVAAAETAAAMALYTFLAVPVWCENMIGTVVPVSGLCAGVAVLLLPLRGSVWRRRIWMLAGVLSGMLALSSYGGIWFWLIPLGWLLWFMGGAAVFAVLRREDHRAAFCGVAAGAAAGVVLILVARRFGVGLPPVAVLACLLLIPSWLRR